MVGSRGVPRSDEVIGRWFAEARRGLSGRRLERVRSAEADLRACLEANAPQLLTATERALLTLERQFDDRGAAARVAEAGVVLLVLPVFLEEPRWFGEDVEDRRVRIRLAEPLAYSVARAPGLRAASLGPAVWTVEATVEHAIWMLRMERAALRHG
ncbi:hypothetical protein [uncultured Amnibacterium sp.]|uniref:hypothetical protein n=1 Tax=uncultured Amnibacterium sp. TaxID=1631851 RepID=UPI0035CB392D